ncbi:MAG: HAD family hydrolase, partial [Pseudomonadota bacterium]
LRTALGAKFPMAAFREELERLWEEFIHENGMPLKPGIKQALNTLQEHSIPYAIATSTPHERARLSLKIAGILDCFDVIVGGDQVSNGKPAPDIFISAAEKISIDPSQCIAVEDSAVGTRAATSAGMYTILIPDLKQPDGEIRELAHEIHQSMDHALPNIMALLQHTKPSNLS